MWWQSFPTLISDIKARTIFNYRANSYIGIITDKQYDNIMYIQEKGKAEGTRVITIITLKSGEEWIDYYICLKHHFIPHLQKNGSWYFEGTIINSCTGQILREGPISLIEFHGKFKVVE